MSYLSFIEMKDDKRITKQFYIFNVASGVIIGYIVFFPQWRKYVLVPEERTKVIFDSKCLLEIIKFLDKVNQERQIELKERKGEKNVKI